MIDSMKKIKVLLGERIGKASQGRRAEAIRLTGCSGQASCGRCEQPRENGVRTKQTAEGNVSPRQRGQPDFHSCDITFLF